MDLAPALPKVANWALSSLPKYISAGAVQRVLDQCDRQTAVGRRNYAVLLLLARLGIRGGSVILLLIVIVLQTVELLRRRFDASRCSFRVGVPCADQHLAQWRSDNSGLSSPFELLLRLANLLSGDKAPCFAQHSHNIHSRSGRSAP